MSKNKPEMPKRIASTEYRQSFSYWVDGRKTSKEAKDGVDVGAAEVAQEQLIQAVLAGDAYATMEATEAYAETATSVTNSMRKAGTNQKGLIHPDDHPELIKKIEALDARQTLSASEKRSLLAKHLQKLTLNRVAKLYDKDRDLPKGLSIRVTADPSQPIEITTETGDIGMLANSKNEVVRLCGVYLAMGNNNSHRRKLKPFSQMFKAVLGEGISEFDFLQPDGR